MNQVRDQEPKLTSRIGFKLTLWVGLFLLVLTAISAYVAVRSQEDSAIQKTLTSGQWFSDTVKRATHHGMLTDQRESVHQIIEAIGKQKGVETIRVFNKKGRIMFSSRASEIGRMVDMQAEACYGCHFKDRPLERLPTNERNRIFTTAGPGGHRVLGVINPIYTEKSCYTDPCHVHPPSQSVLGVLDVGISLAGVDAETRANTRKVVGIALLMSVVICGVVAAATYHFVNRPLSSLTQASRRIADGDYDHPINNIGPDEIGQLATTFESMRRAVKEKTRELSESRRQYRTLFEQVPCYVTVQDRDLKLVAFNKFFERDFGPSMGEFCYVAYKGRQDPCPGCAVIKSFTDGRVHSAEEMVVGADGSPRYFLNLTTPITDMQGNITSVMEMATDITEIRRLERELVASEAKYRLFFDNDPNPIFVFDLKSLDIIDANQRATAEYGYAPGDLPGRSFLEVLHPTERRRVRSALDEGEAFLPTVRMAKKGGGEMFVNLRASHGEYQGKSAVIATTSDVTERLKTEQQLIQAAKMATLGEMSAGVAHELNQPLSVIATGSGFLVKQVDRGRILDPETLKEVAAELAAQVERARRIIDHLRQFGRKAEEPGGRVNLNDPVHGVFALLGQQLKVHNINVKTDLADDLPPITGDLNRLEQVLINLILNARDAIEDRRQHNGEARLTGLIEVRSRAEGGRVVLTVTDNGAGMTNEMSERIFEPFYTTKEVGKGTGLGLSISYGIVRDFGGDITVASAPGQGATFRLSFPALSGEEGA